MSDDLIEIICRRLHSQAYCNSNVDNEWQDFIDDAKEILSDIRADLAEKPAPDDAEVQEAVEWIQKYYLNEPHGDHNPFPAYIETLIRAAQSQNTLAVTEEMVEHGMTAAKAANWEMVHHPIKHTTKERILVRAVLEAGLNIHAQSQNKNGDTK